jgi:hypothetical protein
LKPEWWGSPLVQEEKYQEKPVKREEEIIKIIIIILTIKLSKYISYSMYLKINVNKCQHSSKLPPQYS